MTGIILSHDLGTTGNKATLVDADGHVLGAVSVAYGADFGHGGRAEQRPDDWWDAVCTASRGLLDAFPGAREHIAGVSFSGQMMGAVLVDAVGIPVRPAIIWADTRSTAQAAQLNDRVGEKRGYLITGHRLNATYSLSKVMFVRDEEPDVFARAEQLLSAKDYVVFRLTGELVTDPSDASGTNAFDQASGDWSDELIDAADLDRGLFPRIVPSTSVIGGVTADAAVATGLIAGTPVVVGGGDGPMAALGAGIVDATSGAYGYLGTSSWLSYAADAPLHDPAMRTMTFNHVIPGGFVPTATMQTGGGALEWISDVLAPDAGAERYSSLLGAAAETEAAFEDLYFLPHLLGERSPYWNPRARAAFVGLARHHDRAHLTRAVIEGVAFNLYTGLQAFLQNGAAITAVDLIGGAANSSVVLGLLGDVWGIPVRRRDLVDEATALGAAVVGGIGVGLFDSFEVAGRMSQLSEPTMPDLARHERYRRAHGSFLDAYTRLEPWFDAHGGKE